LELFNFALLPKVNQLLELRELTLNLVFHGLIELSALRSDINAVLVHVVVASEQHIFLFDPVVYFAAVVDFFMDVQ
jgi:hypothetical protein